MNTMDTRPLLRAGRRRRNRAQRWSASVLVIFVACRASDSSSEADEAGATTGAQWPATCPPELAVPSVICDGSDALRFAATQFESGLVLHDLVWDIGTFYLYIDGQCRYWAFDPESNPPVGNTYLGTLTPDQEVELARAFSYPCLDELAGYYAVPGDDVPSRLFSDGVNTVHCLGSCVGNPPEVAPSDVRALDDALMDVWMPALQEAGTPDTGPMRVAVIYDPGLEEPSICAEPWPFSWPPTELALAYGEDYPGTPGTVVDDQATVDLIRELQRHYLEDVPSSDGCNLVLRWGELLFEYEGVEYVLVARNVVPFEDDDGRMQIPDAPGL